MQDNGAASEMNDNSLPIICIPAAILRSFAGDDNGREATSAKDVNDEALNNLDCNSVARWAIGAGANLYLDARQGS